MKILKWIGLSILSLILLGFIAYLVADEPLPNGEKGKKAEMLADIILQAINDSAWNATAVVSWNFADRHQYVWDKSRHYAQVTYGNKEVFINLNHISGQAFTDGEKVTDEKENAKLVQEAYTFWANDSFWLNPLSKIRDFGTERYYVPKNEQNKEFLLVTYTSGGVTPGDSYLWKVNSTTGIPESVKMWVNIIPIGGVEFTWDDWLKTETGVLIAQNHQGLINVNISNIHTYANYANFNKVDIFEVIE